jgi:hypothetical protein
MNKIFFESKKESDRMCQADFESIYVSQFQLYFLKMTINLFKKVLKYLKIDIALKMIFMLYFSRLMKNHKNFFIYFNFEDFGNFSTVR